MVRRTWTKCTLFETKIQARVFVMVCCWFRFLFVIFSLCLRLLNLSNQRSESESEKKTHTHTYIYIGRTPFHYQFVGQRYYKRHKSNTLPRYLISYAVSQADCHLMWACARCICTRYIAMSHIFSVVLEQVIGFLNQNLSNRQKKDSNRFSRAPAIFSQLKKGAFLKCGVVE